MTRSDLRLGMVGLGALGLPMAVNLHRAGFPLQVHTRSRDAERNPALLGCQGCATAAETADGVDILVLCVSDDNAVNAAVTHQQVRAESDHCYRDIAGPLGQEQLQILRVCGFEQDLRRTTSSEPGSAP